MQLKKTSTLILSSQTNLVKYSSKQRSTGCTSHPTLVLASTPALAPALRELLFIGTRLISDGSQISQAVYDQVCVALEQHLDGVGISLLLQSYSSFSEVGRIHAPSTGWRKQIHRVTTDDHEIF
eukprot:XP_001706869.1 Hypothetical protein GL50803_32144 [Giardia lamblia ATCC 50803]